MITVKPSPLFFKTTLYQTKVVLKEGFLLVSWCFELSQPLKDNIRSDLKEELSLNRRSFKCKYERIKRFQKKRGVKGEAVSFIRRKHCIIHSPNFGTGPKGMEFKSLGPPLPMVAERVMADRRKL